MEPNTWNDSAWTEHTSSTPNDPFSVHRHSIFGSGTESNRGPPLYLINQGSLGAVERSNHSRESFNTHNEVTRADSVPVEQLREEILWPQHQVDVLERDQQQHALKRQDTWQSTSTETLLSTEVQWDHATEESNDPQPAAAPIVVKRKRGRPRLYATPPYEQGSDLYGDPASDSRKSQLEKNRIAAEKSRRRRKEHTNGLTAKATVLSSRNEALKAEESALREELLNLKNEILRHAGCSSSIIDGYIARIAGSKLVEMAPKQILSRKDSGQTPSPGSCDYNEKSPSMAAWKGGHIQAGVGDANAPTATSSRDLFEMMNDFLDAER